MGSEALVDGEITSASAACARTLCRVGRARHLGRARHNSAGRASSTVSTDGADGGGAGRVDRWHQPRAFATIIFFASYLAISRPAPHLIPVGLAFALGVFVAYLTVGLGAMGLLAMVSSVRWLGLLLYGVMAAACFVSPSSAYDSSGQARPPARYEAEPASTMRDRIKGRIRLPAALCRSSLCLGADRVTDGVACTSGLPANDLVHGGHPRDARPGRAVSAGL